MVNLVALHGFWGEPADWKDFVSQLNPDQVWVPDFFEAGELDPSHNLADWTKIFTRQVEERFRAPVWLAGYSQGGRLALNAVVARPDLFSRTLLISTHPGQLGSPEAAAREQWIQKWREKFLGLSWPELETEWNQQEAFSGDAASCKHRQADRKLLAQALENWSLLKHGFGWPELKSLPRSVTWLYGAMDHKFLAVKSNLEKQNVGGRVAVIPQAGHRILKDAPTAAASKWKDQK